MKYMLKNRYQKKKKNSRAQRPKNCRRRRAVGYVKENPLSTHILLNFISEGDIVSSPPVNDKLYPRLNVVEVGYEHK